MSDYKVGDRVLIIKDEYGDPVGSIVELTDVGNFDGYDVGYKSVKYSWAHFGASFDCIERVSEGGA